MKKVCATYCQNHNLVVSFRKYPSKTVKKESAYERKKTNRKTETTQPLGFFIAGSVGASPKGADAFLPTSGNFIFMKSDTFYFPHDYNATQDTKMLSLLHECGLEGIGAYWVTIELLHQQPEGRMHISVLENNIRMYFSFPNRGEQHMSNICSTMVSTELLQKDGDFIFSNRVLDNKKHREMVSHSRSIAGKASANKRLGTNVQQYKGKERKGKERKVNNISIPPTLEEVSKYCLDRKNGVDVNKWFNHYEAKGWLIGKTKMKNWQAAIRTWERPETQSRYKPL